MFNKVKFSDRTKLLLPKNACYLFKLQKIPEFLVEESAVSEWDHQGLAKQIDIRATMTEGPTETLNQNIIVMANGATGTISEDSFLHYLTSIFPSIPTSASNLVCQQNWEFNSEFAWILCCCEVIFEC